MANAAKTKAETIVHLEAIIQDVTANLGRTREAFDAQRRELEAAIKREKETRAQFDDLKERLANAEATNNEMRGYLARVREDDIVREELIAIGDPAGEQQLVPKRKSQSFSQPSPYTEFGGRAGGDMVSSYVRDRDRPKPKHWVTY